MTPPTPQARALPWIEPVDAFRALAGRPGGVLLESAKVRGDLGRYSFVATDPFWTFTSKDGRIRLNGASLTGDPFAVLQRALVATRLSSRPDLPPFQGGVAGWFGYDLVQHLEHVPPHASDDMGFPDLSLGFYDVVIAFDHLEGRCWLVSSGLPERTPEARLMRAHVRAEAFADRLGHSSGPAPAPTTAGPVAVEATFAREAYEAAVQRVIDYILAGDIFQANLSQRFRAELPEGLTPLDLYRRLRAINPAPFAAFLDFGKTCIASASPERFLRLDRGDVETRPIKGTRPRGRTEAEDARLAAELEASEKDRAENVMIVDLLRNDLSRVCRDGTVETPRICALESFATVHHLVSDVTGTLRDGCDAVDLLRATFPGGSITGAPKIRAMEIIAELEPTRRGPYCGAVGWIGFDGNMDTSIVIRTYAIRDRTVTFQAGGGIVADSDPVAEYDETIAKARALIEALGGRLDLPDR